MPPARSISSRAVTPAGARITPRFLHASGHRPRTRSLGRSGALLGKPFRALRKYLRHPVQCLYVLIERWPTEQTDFSNVRRAVPRVAALALDQLDHRQLFTADICSSAAAKLDLSLGDELRFFQRRDLVCEDVQDGRVLVSHVKIDPLGFHRPCGNQRAFEHTVRLALKIIAIFEGTGLALIAVDGHEARSRVAAHNLPFASGRETRAAQSTQARFAQIIHDRIQNSCGPRGSVAAPSSRRPLDRRRGPDRAG